MENKFLLLGLAFLLVISFVSSENICTSDSCYNQGSLNIDFNNQAVCGNGIIENTEQCDTNSFNGLTCVNLGYDRGTLACSTSCNLVSSGCRNVGGGGSDNTVTTISPNISPNSNSSANIYSTNGEIDLDQSSEDSNSNSAPITGSATGLIMARLSWAILALLVVGLIVFFIMRRR